MNNIHCLLFDWGDTLMLDDPSDTSEMYTWETITPMDGVVDLMPQLSRKYTCAVVSNASASNAVTMKMAFERVSLAQYFHTFITSKELGAKKPQPEFFLRALQQLNADAETTVMVGNDYEKDIAPAKAVGLATILITKANGSYTHADYVLSSFAELSFLLQD